MMWAVALFCWLLLVALAITSDFWFWRLRYFKSTSELADVIAREYVGSLPPTIGAACDHEKFGAKATIVHHLNKTVTASEDKIRVSLLSVALSSAMVGLFAALAAFAGQLPDNIWLRLMILSISISLFTPVYFRISILREQCRDYLTSMEKELLLSSVK